MGVQESKEESSSALSILQELSNDQLSQALAKLEDLSKNKYEMQVSKWDLLVILQIKSIEVKRVMQLITQKTEPTHLSIHVLVIALLFCKQRDISFGDGPTDVNVELRLQRIMKIVCFEVQPNEIQRTEIDYLNQLINQWIEVTTCFKMSENQAFQSLCDKAFRGQDLVNINHFVATVKDMPELKGLFEIYQKEKKPQSYEQEELEAPEEVEELHQTDQQQVGLPQLNRHVSKRVSALNKPSTLSANNQSDLPQEETKQKVPPQLKKSQMSFQKPVPQEDLSQLHWNTQVLSLINRNQNTKLLQVPLNPQLSAKMAQKLSAVRLANQARINPDTSFDLKELMQHFSMVDKVSKDIYGQKQLTYMMKSNFFEHALVTSRFSIRDFVRAGQSELLESNEQQAFDRIMCKAQAALTFKEFFKQNLTEIQYQLKEHQSRVIYFLMRHGEKNILEKRKQKYIGELNMLNTLIANAYDKVQEQNVTIKVKEQNRQSVQQAQGSNMMSKQISQGTSNNFVPNQNELFKRIYSEFERLRSCGCSRRDLAKFMEIRDQKTMASKIICFWKGVLKTLSSVDQVQTFNELDYFKEFSMFANRSLQIEENNYRQLLMEQMEIKNSFNEYSMQLGKLKALDFALRNNRLSLDKFIATLKERIAELFSKLEEVDISMVEALYSQVLKKRSQKLYFLSIGQIACYKVITKGLGYERALDYLGINVCRYRMWKLMGIVSTQDKSNTEERQAFEENKMAAEVQKYVLIMVKMQEIDQFFNYDAGSTDSAKADRFYDNFAEECEQIANDQFESSQNPDVPLVRSPSDLLPPTVADSVYKMMKIFYSRHRVDLQLLKPFHEFLGNLESQFKLIGELSYATNKLQDAGTLLFDFIDIEERFVDSSDKKKADDTLQWIMTLSSSLAQTNFEPVVGKLKETMTQAHLGCQKYANNLCLFSENDFLEQFKSQRSTVFSNFIKALQSVNKGYNFNGFDILHFSLPLEYSMTNNYWCAQSLQLCLNLSQKEEKFQQLLQVNSPILLSRRSTYLNVKIASQLILAAFQLGPQSVKGSDNNSNADDQDYERDKKDFDLQFRLTRGEQSEESRVMKLCFTDYYEQAICILKQMEQEKQEGDLILQSKETLSSSQKILEYLRDRIESIKLDNNPAELALRYEQQKLNQLDGLKRQAIRHLFEGARDFIDTLVGSQKSDNAFSSSATSITFKQGIENALVELKKIHDIEDAEKGKEVIQLKTSSSNSSLQINIQKTKKTAGKKLKTKKEVHFTPLQESEFAIMETLSKTNYLQKLVRIINEDPKRDSANFFSFLETELGQRRKQIDRLRSVLAFLRANLKRQEVEGFVYKGVNEHELGCRLVQDIQSGLLVQPVFVYCPSETKQEGGLLNVTGTKKSGLLSQMLIQPPPKEKTSGIINLQTPKYRSSIQTMVGTQRESKDQSRTVTEKTQLGGFPSPQFVNEAKEKQELTTQSAQLSYNQRACNYLLQFFNQVCLLDDKLTAKQILKNDSIFGYLSLMSIQISEQEAMINLREHIDKGLNQLINVYEVQKTPLDFFLDKYERVCKFIQRDLVNQIYDTDEGHLKFFFFDIMSKKGSALIKQTINKVDSYFSLAVIGDVDKLEFTNAHQKIKRELDQNLRTFKEFLDLEENKKVAKSHESLLKHQELRLIQEISSLSLLVRIYYLKQIALQQPNVLF